MKDLNDQIDNMKLEHEQNMQAAKDNLEDLYGKIEYQTKRKEELKDIEKNSAEIKAKNIMIAKENRVLFSLIKSEKYRVGSYVPKPIGFFPTELQIVKMTVPYLKQLYVKAIQYHIGSPLYQLTFVFSDGQRSPPKHFAFADGLEMQEYKFPGKTEIGEIVFGMTHNPYLVSMTLLDPAEKVI